MWKISHRNENVNNSIFHMEKINNNKLPEMESEHARNEIITKYTHYYYLYM